MVIGYSPGEENVSAATAVVPREDFTAERILKHFPCLLGQTANDSKEIGKRSEEHTSELQSR